MGWKRDAFEYVPRLCAAFARRASDPPAEPRSIFVLRNNDLGDVLVITPLFEALRRRFPEARIIAGVGDWAAPILEGNPNVDEVMSVNAPWHNAQSMPAGSAAALRYIAFSGEARALAARRFEIGIDVLGSAFGSLLLMRAAIPWRLGVSGYAGGHSAAQRCISFDPNEHVGRSALRFAELLGAADLPENRPQIYLRSSSPQTDAIVFAPGGGYASKCWPAEHFAALSALLPDFPITVIGSEKDRAAGALVARTGSHVGDLTGQLSLRDSFAMISAARMVVCNSSMAMHAAAAFRKPAVVMLGPEISCARQHASQWAYSETRVFSQPSPKEACDVVRLALSQAR